MKRLLSTLLALTMALALVSCGKSNPTPNTGSNKTETPSETADTKTEGNVHIVRMSIGIYFTAVTGFLNTT